MPPAHRLPILTLCIGDLIEKHLKLHALHWAVLLTIWRIEDSNTIAVATITSGPHSLLPLVDVWHTELWIVVGAKTNELQHKFEVNIVAVLQFQLKMITDDGNSAFAAATSHIHRSWDWVCKYRVVVAATKRNNRLGNKWKAFVCKWCIKSFHIEWERERDSVFIDESSLGNFICWLSPFLVHRPALHMSLAQSTHNLLQLRYWFAIRGDLVTVMHLGRPYSVEKGFTYL